MRTHIPQTGASRAAAMSSFVSRSLPGAGKAQTSLVRRSQTKSRRIHAREVEVRTEISLVKQRALRVPQIPNRRAQSPRLPNNPRLSPRRSSLPTHGSRSCERRTSRGPFRLLITPSKHSQLPHSARRVLGSKPGLELNPGPLPKPVWLLKLKKLSPPSMERLLKSQPRPILLM